MVCIILVLITTVLISSNNVRIPIAEGIYIFSKKWGTLGSENGQFRIPTAVAIDSTDRVYVLDTGNIRVQKFLLADVCPETSIQTSPGVCLVRKWGESASNGLGSGTFHSPRDLAIDPSGRVYVADTEHHRIQMFKGVGTFIRTWPNIGDALFAFPLGVAVDPIGNIYTIDQFQIKRFHLANPCPTSTTQAVNGVCLGIKWGSRGIGNGQFMGFGDIAADSQGNIYVIDKGNNRIQKFQLTSPCPKQTTQITVGVCFVTKWGTLGSGNGQFDRAGGIAVDSSGYVYVTDFGNHRVQKFQLTNACPPGTTQVGVGVCFVTKWGSQGSENGQFLYPIGIDIDSMGRVYVADAGNSRVQVFFWEPNNDDSIKSSNEPDIAIR